MTQPAVTTVVRSLQTAVDVAFQNNMITEFKTETTRFRSDLEAELTRKLQASGFPAADQATIYTNVITALKGVLWT